MTLLYKYGCDIIDNLLDEITSTNKGIYESFSNITGDTET